MICSKCGLENSDRDVIAVEYIQDGFSVQKLTTYKCDCGHLFMTEIWYHQQFDEEIVDDNI